MLSHPWSISPALTAVLLAGGQALVGQVKQLRVVPDPEFDASALDLSQPPFLVVDPQNRVYLTDAGAIRLLRLSADGRQSEVLVREGAGPGEARGFVGMGWKGDTLWFYDNRLARYTLLDARGKFVRTMSYSERCVTTLPWALMAGDGCLEGISTRHPYANATDPVPPTPVVLVSQHKRRTDTLGVLSRDHSVMQFDQKDGKALTRQPFGDDGWIWPFEDGISAFEVVRRAATSPRADSVLIRKWTSGAGWDSFRAIHYIPRPLAEGSIDSALSASVNRSKGFTPWVTLDSLRKRVYRPRFYPPAPRVVASAENGVWVQLIQLADPPGVVTWVVLDTQLRETARVTAPAALNVLAIRGEFCWGYVLNEDDVPVVVRYRVVH